MILSNGVVLFLSQSIIETFPLAREDKSKCAVANRHGSFAAGSGIRCRGYARHGMERGLITTMNTNEK